MSNPLFDSANKYRSVILWAEIAGCLHDIGKFSSDFIEYRANWHKESGKKDPHTNELLDNILNELNNLPEEEQYLKSQLKELLSNSAMWPIEIESCTLEDLIKEHNNKESLKGILCRNLFWSDSADAAEDRNNPLYSGEQRGAGDKYKSTVFGYETKLDYKEFDGQRNELIEELKILLPDYFKVLKANADNELIISKRRKILKLLRDKFKDAVSDTVRPANDVNLWQHSYSTATIFKAQIAASFYSLTTKLPANNKDVKFDLLGIGWDGFSFLSQGHKLGDLAARESLIRRIKENLREVIEVGYAIGNSVYDDVDCICFLTAAGSSTSQGLINEIAKAVNKVSDGELTAQFALKESRGFLGEIVKVIRTLRGEERDDALAYNESIKQPQPSIEVNPKWSERWKNDGKQSICPICQKRPYNDRKYTVCEICKNRRINIAEKARENNNLQTRFVGEIADANGRVALLALRFGLDDWTSGNMIRTLMVKGASAFDEEIKDLGNIKDFEEADAERELLKTEVPYNWQKINDDVKEFIRIKQPSVLSDEDISRQKFYLYGHPDRYKKPSEITKEDIEKYIDNIKAQAINELGSSHPVDLTNVIIIGKWPTPGRLLQTWENTRAFISSVTDEYFLKKDYLSKNEIESHNLNGTRLKLSGSFEAKRAKVLPVEYAVYEAYVASTDLDNNNVGRKFSVFFIKENDNYACYLLDDQDSRYLKNNDKFVIGTNLNILTNEYEKQTDQGIIGSFIIEAKTEEGYQKWRLITKTPTTALMLVPAKTALALIDKLNEKYDEELGKVKGRLPLSAGLIFFKEHTPMFAVLDAGRRMIKDFDNKMKFKLNNEGTNATIKVAGDKTNIKFNEKPIVWEIARQLADGTSDFYHPRLLLAEGQKVKDLEKYKDFVKTSMGSSLSVLDFNEDKDIELNLNIIPNYFAYVALDNASRRLKIGIDKKQSDELFQELTIKPYWLDEIKRFIEIWDALKDGDLTNTQLRNFESLMIGKYKKWYIEDSDNKLFEEEWVKLCDSLSWKSAEIATFINKGNLKSYRYKLLVDIIQINLHILKNKVNKSPDGD